MIRLNRGIAIDEREIDFDFIRSSGPGGQNVNKVSTAVRLTFRCARVELASGRRARAVDSPGRQASRRRRLSHDPRAQRPHPGVEPSRRHRALRGTARAGRRAARRRAARPGRRPARASAGSMPSAAAARPSRRGDRKSREITPDMGLIKKFTAPTRRTLMTVCGEIAPRLQRRLAVRP